MSPKLAPGPEWLVPKLAGKTSAVPALLFSLLDRSIPFLSRLARWSSLPMGARCRKAAGHDDAAVR